MWPQQDASRGEKSNDQRYPAVSVSDWPCISTADVAIYANGQPLTVPYGIGIGKPWQVQQSTEGPFVVEGSCFYWLHTHTDEGIMHIESPVQRTFTLGDFFAVWGQPLGSSQAA